MPTFGVLLRRHRRAAGLTQEALAERARLSARAITALERGVNQSPRGTTLQLLADALGLSEQARAQLERAAHRHHFDALQARTDIIAMGRALMPLVGRGHEVGVLRSHLAGDCPPLLLFAGEPGIGKTRLLQEATQLALRAGLTVLQGECDRRKGQDPYTPLLQALEHYIGILSPRQVRAALQGCAWLVRLLPELHQMVEAPFPFGMLPAEQERRLIFNSVRRFLANVAGPDGVLLVVDDLQWAGSDALALVTTLVQSPSDFSLRVVGAYRDTEVDRYHPLSSTLADLARGSLADVVTPGGLSAGDSADLLEKLVENRDSVSPEAMASVIRIAEGVPFFLVSYAVGLQTSLSIFGQDAQAGLPWNLAQSIRQRIAALPQDTQELLEAAAVIGRVVAPSLLADVVHQTQKQVLASLSAAWRAGLLVQGENRTYQFTHDVIRDAVEADLEAPRRVLLHYQVAEALVQKPTHRLHGWAAEIAGHFIEGNNSQTALPYVLLAGDQSEEIFAHGEAEHHYRTALQLAREVRDREHEVQSIEKLGGILKIAGRYGEALDVLEEVAEAYRAAGDVQSEGRVVAQIGWIHVERETAEEGIARVQPVVEVLEARLLSTTLAQLHMVLTSLFIRQERREDALASATRASDVARALEDAGLLAAAEERVGMTLRLMGLREDALRVMRDVIPLAERSRDLDTLIRALNTATGIYQERGEHLEALRSIEQGLEVAERMQDPHWMGVMGRHLIWIGEWSKARTYLERALDSFQNLGLPAAFGYPLLVQLGDLYTCQGEREAAACLEEGLRLAEDNGDTASSLFATRLLATIDLREGRREAAIARLETHLHAYEEGRWGGALGTLAEAYLELGNVNQAERIATSAVERGRETPQTFNEAFAAPPMTTALRVQGMALSRQRRWAEAQSAFEQAVSLAARGHFVWFQAQALHEYGMMLLQKGELEQAGERLEQALGMFQTLDSPWYVERTKRALGNFC